MSSLQKTLLDADDTATLLAGRPKEFLHDSLPDIFEQAKAKTLTFWTGETHLLTEPQALCDSLEQKQLDTLNADTLQRLRAALGLRFVPSPVQKTIGIIYDVKHAALH